MCVYHVSVSNVHFDDALESCFSSCSWTSSQWRWGCGVRISQNSPSVSHPIYNSPQFGPILLTFDVLDVFAMGIIWVSIFRYLFFIDFHDRSLQEDPYHNRCPLVTPLSFACCLCKPWMIALSTRYIKGDPHRKHLATAKRWEYIPQSFNAWYHLQRRHHLLTCFPKNLCQMLKSSQDLEDLLIYKLWELLSQKTSKASAKSRHLLRLLRLDILHLNRQGSLGKIRLPSIALAQKVSESSTKSHDVDAKNPARFAWLRQDVPLSHSTLFHPLPPFPPTDCQPRCEGLSRNTFHIYFHILPQLWLFPTFILVLSFKHSL